MESQKQYFVYFEDWHGNDKGYDGPFETYEDAEQAGIDKQNFHNMTWEYSIEEQELD